MPPVGSGPASPEELFAGHAVPLAVVERVRAALSPWPDVEVRTSRSQVAFRRRRGLASVWRPGQYLRSAAPAVLTIVLGRAETSPRFKGVVHPSPAHWVHHLELATADDVDAEVEAWLAEAAERAG